MIQSLMARCDRHTAPGAWRVFCCEPGRQQWVAQHRASCGFDAVDQNTATVHADGAY